MGVGASGWGLLRNRVVVEGRGWGFNLFIDEDLTLFCLYAEICTSGACFQDQIFINAALSLSLPDLVFSAFPTPFHHCVIIGLSGIALDADKFLDTPNRPIFWTLRISSQSNFAKIGFITEIFTLGTSTVVVALMLC